MKQGFEELQPSKLLEKTLKVGDSAPNFVLPNGEGKMIDSETLRHQGPLVILFYRGKW
jgi:peroxiredoxin